MNSHLNCHNDLFPPVGMASAKPGFLLGENGWYGSLGILPHCRMKPMLLKHGRVGEGSV